MSQEEANMAITPFAVDLSHYDPASDYGKVKSAGIVGVIYKATEDTNSTDHTYVAQQHAAKAAGLKWGAYHFGHPGNIQEQIDNFMRFAAPDPDELFCLDWEAASNGTMSAAEAQQWIEGVERALGRPGECVIYSGNAAKEKISGKKPILRREEAVVGAVQYDAACARKLDDMVAMAIHRRQIRSNAAYGAWRSGKRSGREHL
jgi:GH25 family lysozyme M1 (1,4-beta-N-acetylmuramidase)